VLRVRLRGGKPECSEKDLFHLIAKIKKNFRKYEHEGPCWRKKFGQHRFCEAITLTLINAHTSHVLVVRTHWRWSMHISWMCRPHRVYWWWSVHIFYDNFVNIFSVKIYFTSSRLLTDLHRRNYVDSSRTSNTTETTMKKMDSASKVWGEGQALSHGWLWWRQGWGVMWWTTPLVDQVKLLISGDFGTAHKQWFGARNVVSILNVLAKFLYPTGTEIPHRLKISPETLSGLCNPTFHGPKCPRFW
jgi:hypothetical protein